MRYESEVLYDLMKRDGLLNPSQNNLPYESELKEKYVNDVKGAYPKLIDYRSEWLNYAYENPIGEFPYETLTNVTEATINNVVPYAYKSAILKGQTLVNVHGKKAYGLTQSEETMGANKFTNIVKGENQLSFDMIDELIYGWGSFVNGGSLNLDMLKPNTKYLVYFTTAIFPEYFGVSFRNGDGSNFISTQVQINKGGNCAIITTTNEIVKSNQILYISIPQEHAGHYEFKDAMIIEYQKGMENWDIPYFEGMQSVKMPVLTTSNEDGTKTNILTVNEDVELRGIGEVQDTLDCLTGELTKRIDEVVLNGSEQWYGDGVYFYHNSLKPKNKNVICDKIVVDKIKNHNPTTTVATFSGGGNLEIFIQGVSTKDEFLNWLSVNKPRFTYESSEKSVKTVDLLIVDKDGNQLNKLTPIEGTMNLRTDGTPLKPSFSGEIPVEAITQNIASFIE